MEKMAQGGSTVLKRMWNTKHNLPFMDKCKIKLQ